MEIIPQNHTFYMLITTELNDMIQNWLQGREGTKIFI